MHKTRFTLLIVIIVLINISSVAYALAFEVPMSLIVLSSGDVRISNIRYDSVFQNKEDTDMSISFKLSKNADITIQIKSIFDGNKTIYVLGPISGKSGENTIDWNCRVQPSWYECEVKATDGSTDDTRSFKIAVAGGSSLQLRDYKIRPFSVCLPNGVANIGLYQSRDAYVNIDIRNENGGLIKNLSKLKWRHGENYYEWNCISNEGELVDPGKYTCTIIGVDSDGNTKRLDKAFVVGPKPKSLIQISKDAVKGIFRFDLINFLRLKTGII